MDQDNTNTTLGEAVRAGEILHRCRLSSTESRRAILELFIQSGEALAHADVEKHTGERFDRVTVYRTLQAFLDKGIIHTVPTADNAIRYALCNETCMEGHHHDNHVHFYCSSCGKTTCLDEVIVPEVQLPEGFRPEESQMIVSGVCGACRQG